MISSAENDEDREGDDGPSPSKKQKLFCATHFRRKLKTAERNQELQSFLKLTAQNDNECIFLYLDGGGGCMEMLQLLDLDDAPQLTIVQICKNLLVKIVSSRPDLHTSAYEACKYFLHNHLSIVHKMLNLSSTSKERIAMLKYLSVMATFSVNLAKEILQNINLTLPNLEMLSKPSGSKDKPWDVRRAFIHFLLAFLVEGHPATVSLLTEKKLTGFVFTGLKFDSAQTVSLVLSTFTSYVLKTPSIKKTIKMKIFNTIAIKDIVNLYNWKGPEGFDATKKQQIFQPDPVLKSQVNETVHEFLLILCTSKHGVIFRDNLVGLGKEKHNVLMGTLLESLDRPWEHSYAGDLVAKMCTSCPDIVKNVWGNLKPFLEPTNSERWKSALKFAKKLTQELQPECIEYCAHGLSPYQLAQITQMLVAPTPILKTLYQEQTGPTPHNLKFELYTLAQYFLKSILTYLQAGKSWFSEENYKIYKTLLSEHVSRNFPNASVLLKNWNEPSTDFNSIDLLDVITSVIDSYQILSPNLLESLDTVNMEDLFTEINKENPPKKSDILIKIAKIFIDFDPSIFASDSKIFQEIFTYSLQFYHRNKTVNAYQLLEKLLLNTKLFEGCIDEISIWINTIFDVKFDSDLSQKLSAIFALIANNRDDSSAVILGFFRNMQPDLTDYLSCALINLLHVQTDPDAILTIVSDNKKYVDKAVMKYFRKWGENPMCSLPEKENWSKTYSFKRGLNVCALYSRWEEEIEEFWTDFGHEIGKYPGQDIDLLNLILSGFYRSIRLQLINEQHLHNCIQLIKLLIGKTSDPKVFFAKIFTHPVLIDNFSFNNANKSLCTQFLLTLVKELKKEHSESLEIYLTPFRDKLVKNFGKLIKKPDKLENLFASFETLGLKYDQYVKLIEISCELSPRLLLRSNIFYHILAYALHKLCKLCLNDVKLKPAPKGICEKIAKFITYINSKQNQSENLSSGLHGYLKRFPHCLGEIPEGVFESILKRIDFCKDNADLALFLLKNDAKYLKDFTNNLEIICKKKGLILPLLDAAIKHGIDDEILAKIYELFNPSIVKALEKPQKAGKYFENYPEGVKVMIRKCTPVSFCVNFMQKVNKFDASEDFHADLLGEVFTKGIANCDDNNRREQISCNAILTLTAIANSDFKKKENNAEKIARIIFRFIDNNFSVKKHKISFRSVIETDNFSTFCKFALKFGVTDHVIFLNLIRKIAELFDFLEGEAEFLMDMLWSHSKFLDLILSESDSNCKCGVLELFFVICERWPRLKRTSHVPLLLASYQATISKADLITLQLLQMYEKDASFTNFYDYKPFLWGRAAATHYSVTQNVRKNLWRQPKPSEILEITQESQVQHTFKNYPLKMGLRMKKNTQVDYDDNCYNLSFLLPFFVSLLSPENPAPTYKFTRFGSLSLTILALSSEDKDVRKASCLVLARLHHHLEGLKGGAKDKLIWLRFTEAVCRGTSLMDEVKISNIVAIFWARMALILARPLSPLYGPLSQYLSSKPAPDFNTVPELNALLHSSDMNYRYHRNFILQVLRDGLRTEEDFKLAARSMTYKLIMELYNTDCVVDTNLKLLILEVIEKTVRLEAGRKVLCNSFGLVSWLYEICANINEEHVELFRKVLEIVKVLIRQKYVNCHILAMILQDFIDRHIIGVIPKDSFNDFIMVLTDLYDGKYFNIEETTIRKLITVSEDEYCLYLLEYGCKYIVTSSDLNPIRTLSFKWINNQDKSM